MPIPTARLPADIRQSPVRSAPVLFRHTENRGKQPGKVSLKFFLGFLQLYLCSRNILSVQRFQSAHYGRYQFLFYIHDSNVFSVCKDTNYFNSIKRRRCMRLLFSSFIYDYFIR